MVRVKTYSSRSTTLRQAPEVQQVVQPMIEISSIAPPVLIRIIAKYSGMSCRKRRGARGMEDRARVRQRSASRGLVGQWLWARAAHVDEQRVEADGVGEGVQG